mmetsp:Transcript_4411/g.7900  ORF Transcript_4411/g.7900 Transcript_4411/m.7900 type:complete len:291 (-) Transcript_4411:731-1603(-)|eukprot:CAMPEP_0198288250 /NCGR_PEP_ID=MMETSP1449-20131203/6819_1 /TAXON_ID=420275 /ORGANISM="Attheya septentrionalis, Strain CCMP2084" /LENGTH=290 /DNA_ID=CAMNT_0043986363 /DNA_START=1525 /DNA_END=2397 /DNA_ORIENTATION=+
MNRLILTACLALLGAGTANAKRSFQNGIKKQAVGIPDTKKIVSIRGGAGPIEPVTAAKLVGALYTVQGAVGTLSPTRSNEAYGVKTFVPCNVKLSRETAYCILEHGIIVSCLLVKGTSVNTAVGITSIIWFAEALKSILDKDSENVGPSNVGSLSIMAFAGAAAYAGLTNADWALAAFKARAVYTFLCGIPCVFNGNSAIKLWELKNTDELTPGLFNVLGCSVLNLGALLAALAWGFDPVKAVGYTALVSLLTSFKCTFLSPDFDVLGIDIAPLMFWAALNAVISASILL